MGEQKRKFEAMSDAEKAAYVQHLKDTSAAMEEAMGAPLFDNVKAQCMLAMIIKAPQHEITSTVEEVDNTGGWVAEMDVDIVARTFTFRARKMS